MGQGEGSQGIRGIMRITNTQKLPKRDPYTHVDKI